MNYENFVSEINQKKELLNSEIKKTAINNFLRLNNSAGFDAIQANVKLKTFLVTPIEILNAL